MAAEASIHFHSENIPFRLREIRATRRWLARAIAAEKRSCGTLNYIFCSDAFLLRINEDYLKHDSYTDIITFDYSINNEIVGDIFISAERVKENAKALGTTAKNELHRVMIHGVLHLCGYKDKTSIDKAEMTEKEDNYLSLRDF